MFSLIITIISIALVVALVAATMYYGGSALNQGTVKADAAGFVAGAQQISAALSMHELDGKGNPVAIDDSTNTMYDYIDLLISNNYLATVPVVKSGLQNTRNNPATVAETWAMDPWHVIGVKSVMGANNDIWNDFDITQTELKATVLSPDVCAKLHLDGNKDGANAQPLYDCTEDSVTKLNTFVFAIGQRLVPQD